MRKLIKPMILAMIPVVIALVSYSISQKSPSSSDEISQVNSNNETLQIIEMDDNESKNSGRVSAVTNSNPKKSASLWSTLFGESVDTENEQIQNSINHEPEKDTSINYRKVASNSHFTMRKPITPLTSSSLKNKNSGKVGANSTPNSNNTSVSKGNEQTYYKDENALTTQSLPTGEEKRRPDFTADNNANNPVNDIINNVFNENGANNQQGGSDSATTSTANENNSNSFISGGGTGKSETTEREPASSSSNSNSSNSSTSSKNSGSTNSYLVGGTVSGLNGTLVLQINGSNDLTITQNGKYSFSKYILDQNSYNVTVKTHPTLPQICTVVNGSGTINGNSVTIVNIHCENSFSIGGTLSGLTSGSLVLQNNSGDNLTLTANGTFTFSNEIGDTATYAVTVLTQPDGQNCLVTNGSGTVSNSNITNVSVSCSASTSGTPTTNTYTVGGTISGLNGTVVLQNNGGDNLAYFTNGSFTFVTPLNSGDTYSVTVLTQPANHPTTPHQVCTVTNGSGTITTANISNISINCVTNSYTVSGTVTGLTGVLVLQNNGSDDKTIVSNGSFTFSTAVNDLATYSVSVLTSPTAPSQTCSLSNESGTINDANVTNVSVTCSTNSFTIGGTVSGLNGTVVLQNNSGNNKTITTNGAFTFSSSLTDQAAYAVTVLTLPASQICSVTGNGSGNVNGANVTNVTINCATPTLTFTNIANSYLTINWSSLTAPQSSAASIEYKLYKNTGTVGSPTWTSIQNWTTSLSKYLDTGISAETIYYFKLETRDSTSNMVTTYASIKTPSNGYPAAVLLDASTGGGEEPDISINSSNKSFAVWDSYDSGTSTTTAYVSQNSGTDRNWSSAYKLNSNSTSGFRPQVAVDDLGNAIAIWESDSATTFLYASRYASSAATPSWSTPVNITNIEADANYDANAGSGLSSRRIAMDKLGNALVVWTQDIRISGSWRTHIASNYFDITANSGAGAWLGHDVVDIGSNTAAPTVSSNPKVAFDSSGNAIAIWTQHDGSNYHTFSAKFLKSTKQWSYISQVDNEVTNTYTSDFVFKTDDKLYTIWVGGNSSDTLKGGNLTLSNVGAGWTRETIGSSNYLTNNYSASKVAANATGNVSVAYNLNNTIAVNKYNISTDTWGTPKEFSGAVATPGFINSSTGFDGSSSIFDQSITYQPQVTIDNSNNVLALWTERGHGSTVYAAKMFSAKYNGTTNLWETPILLEYRTLSSGASGLAPYYFNKLVTNPSGKSLVVYRTNSNYDVYVRHLDLNVIGTPYTITYDANNATSGTVPTDSTYYTSSADALGNTGTLVKTGYAFTGWNTAADGSGTLYSATDEVAISSNLTLYATWAPPPTVTTTAISNNVGGGNISTATNCSLTAAGIVWSLSSNPTTADSKTTDGHAGVFTSTMTGLVANTTYYIRAYGTNCAGTSYGNEVTYTTGNYVVRGTGPAGGLIFYDKGSVSDGWRYLEAAPSDYGSTIAWSEVNHLTGNWDVTLGGTGTAIGTGKANSLIITNSKGNGTYAAKAAKDLNIAGYNDWFVPSKSEMNELYTNLKAYGVGSLTTSSYWSSSEATSTNVWSQDFSTGTPNASGQNNTYKLRSIRAFAGDLSQYTVTFDGNGNTGGTVPVDGSSYYQGQAVTMPANTGTLVKAGFSFNGWKTVTSGSGTVYAAGDLFSMPNANTTLYANWVTAPTVTTINADYTSYLTLNTTTAYPGGNVTSDGGGITARGVCWSTSPNPTIADSKSDNGQGTGTFMTYITGLTAGTRYYIRAYATNAAGTSYGQQETFVTAYNTNGGTGPAGGLVFIDQGSYASSWRFIEVAPVGSEHTGKDWGCDGTTIGSTQTNYGTGQSNTTAIVSNSCTTSASAAYYCEHLDYNGFSDWYLPSITDLNTMRNNLHNNGVGNFTTGVTYSSSSEYNTNPSSNIYVMTFNTSSSIGPKSTSRYVRCARSFGNPNLFSITYDGNGNTSGTGPTDTNTYQKGQSVTIASSGTLAKTGYTFVGWNTAADGSGTNYSASDIYTMPTSNITLYANWNIPYITVFATQITDGDLKTAGSGATGRAGADNLCASTKTTSYSGLSCTRVRALMNFNSDTITNMATNYSIPTMLPIQSVGASVIANDWADLTDGTIDMTMSAAGVTSDVFWIGTSGINCTNWTSTAGTGRIGYSNQTNSSWWDGSDLLCNDNTQMRILCVCW